MIKNGGNGAEFKTMKQVCNALKPRIRKDFGYTGWAYHAVWAYQ